MINNKKLYSACRQQPLEVANWDGEKKVTALLLVSEFHPFCIKSNSLFINIIVDHSLLF